MKSHRDRGPALRALPGGASAQRLPRPAVREGGVPGMSMQLLLFQILNGLGIGMIYFLLSVGLTLIFGLMRFVNFAHGAFISSPLTSLLR